jgi:hypothetical protein
LPSRKRASSGVIDVSRLGYQNHSYASFYGPLPRHP